MLFRVLSLGCVALSACDRTPSAFSASPGTSRSPRETIAELIRTRNQAAYRSMSALILPQHADEVVRTITAVDGFLQANRALCDHVRREFSSGLADSIDQAYLGASLDIFSSDVELIDQTISADSAEVTYSVARRIPLKRAALTRARGGWLYDPGPGYNPDLPAAFDRMAEGLRAVLDDLRSGRLTHDAVAENPQKLMEEVRVRLLPGVKLLKRPGAADRKP